MAGLKITLRNELVGAIRKSLDAPTPYPKINELIAKGAVRAATAAICRAVPFAGRAGFRILEANIAYLKAVMPFKGNRNHIGTMYAGALFTLAELPAGVMMELSFDSGFYPILKELKMEYLKVARSDIMVELRLTQEWLLKRKEEAEAQGRSEFEIQSELLDKSGDVVARSCGLYQLRYRHYSKN